MLINRSQMKQLLFTALMLCGCQATPPAPSTTPSPTGHAHTAPHGGSLVELGEEFAHLELIWESSSGRLSVYVLDGEASGGIRLQRKELVLSTGGQKYTLHPVASPLSGETENDTSHFEGTLGSLRGQSHWEAELVEITVRGKKFEHVDIDFPTEHHSHSS
jgi:hypothetical protein